MTKPRADSVPDTARAVHGPLAPRPRRVPPSTWRLPPPEEADEDGVLGVGADLQPATLVDAYRRGAFPWPHQGVPLPWFCPDPRAVIGPQGVHVSRSLRRRLRACGWTSTVDTAFADVVRACARRSDAEGTWITPELAAAYESLHGLGWAHSLEVWEDGRLIGGIYGVQVGAVFTGESMFHHRTDASKVALLDLARRFGEAGGQLFDVQLMTDHLRTMGTIEMPRSTFLAQLRDLRDLDVRLPIDRRDVSRLATST